ncbi:hypothetical protein QBC46DRAFT_290089 [Diplogelasinospora grovesii]|uniref:Lccl domain-containing protein n=1 Tax=Diplogelasinospora grovesii TaxID=303347 RepID=A0AAN6N6F8_9PEZI|nr:hypothetical protein QBC46DRAFT_290089 [Diplogelasinospora grovesii]
MAAPPNKTIKDLGGKWQMNKSQSTPIDPGLALQGIGWVTRKAITMATVTLDIKMFEAAPSPPADPAGPACTHVEIAQTITGGMKGSTEKRCLDYTFREHSDWLFGRVRGQSKWISGSEIQDDFLAKGWLEDEETHILSYVESLDNGWTATQIWGFQMVEGIRKHCRQIVISKGDEAVEMRLVYDYLGEADS